MQRADGQLVIVILVAGLKAARDQRKRVGVLREAELRGLVQDADVLQVKLIGHDVAEGHAVIVSAGFDGEAAGVGGHLRGLHGDGVVAIGYRAGFACHGGPGLVAAGRL